MRTMTLVLDSIVNCISENNLLTLLPQNSSTLSSIRTIQMEQTPSSLL